MSIGSENKIRRRANAPTLAQLVAMPGFQQEFWAKVVDRPSGCREWTGNRSGQGYGVLRVEYKIYAPHRIAYTIAHGQPARGLCVCHRCDNPSCVNPDHLWLGTDAENKADMRAKGRDKGITTSPKKGSANPFSKLTEGDVVVIRQLGRSGMGPTAIAKRFGVTQPAVSDILSGRRWSHVPD